MLQPPLIPDTDADLLIKHFLTAFVYFDMKLMSTWNLSYHIILLLTITECHLREFICIKTEHHQAAIISAVKK